MRAIMSHLITTTATFTVDGDLAGPEVARLAEQLWPHLLTAPPVTLVDLAATASVDAAGIDLVAAAHTYAIHRGLALRLVNTMPGVHSALHVAGADALPARNSRTESRTATATRRAPRRLVAAVTS